MSERTEKPQLSPGDAAQQSPSPDNGVAFRRAESLLAVENENSGERGREAFSAIENREAADRQSSLPDASDALRRRITGDQRSKGDEDVDSAAEVEVDDALDQKALADGVAAADETAQVAWDLTPHNL
jgi:hypothetical protein